MENDTQPQTALVALQSAKAAHHRLDRLEEDVKDVHALAEAMAATQKEMENMKTDMGEVKQSLSILTEQPGGRWDQLVNAVISAVSTGLVGAVLVFILK